MSNTLHEHDFVVLDFTGRLPSGQVFDTTIEAVAKKYQLPTRQAGFMPVTICLGERQLLPGLDAHLIGKECGKTYTILLTAAEAFGKRDVKNVKIVPISSFKEHNLMPRPGLQINIDGEVGTITRVSGGRIIVNFNHALAGQDVVYEITLHQKLTDIKHKVQAFFLTSMRLSPQQVAVHENGEQIHVELGVALPQPVLDIMSKKLTELLEKSVVVASKSV